MSWKGDTDPATNLEVVSTFSFSRFRQIFEVILKLEEGA